MTIIYNFEIIKGLQTSAAAILVTIHGFIGFNISVTETVLALDDIPWEVLKRRGIESVRLMELTRYRGPHHLIMIINFAFKGLSLHSTIK